MNMTNEIFKHGTSKVTNAQSRIVQIGIFTNEVYETLIHQRIGRKVLVRNTTNNAITSKKVHSSLVQARIGIISFKG